MRILYKLTTRSRPEKMFSAIDNIRAMAIERDPWIIVTLDEDDTKCNTNLIRSLLGLIKNIYPVFGTSKNKIDAINRDVPPDGWDMIVATSDDIRFKHGFDLQIQNDSHKAWHDLNRHPESQDAVSSADLKNYDFTIHYTDGADHGLIMTVPIMSKKYYNRLGYLYNPVYTSLFCDEESIAVGNNLKKIYYSGAQIMEHMHPAWGKAEWDEQYKHTDGFYHQDKAIFEGRKAKNFEL